MTEVEPAGAPRSNLRDVQRETTRALLIEAAVRVFARDGYAGATVNAISAEAGASRATFYLHFRTKADVLPELVARSGHRLLGRYLDLGPLIDPPDRAALEGWVRESIRRWPEIEDDMRPVYEAADADPELFGRLFPDDLPGSANLAEALGAAGIGVDAEDTAMRAAVMHAPMYYLLRRHLRREQFDPDRAAIAIAAAWMGVLRDR